MKTNDVTSDTPHSQSEQNSAPSANSDSSFDSISTSEANSLDNGRELNKSGKNNLQEDALGSLEEDVPGEKSNYERKGEDERGDSDSGEVDEHGSIDQAEISEGDMNSEEHVQQLSGQEAVAEHSKGELAKGEHLDENVELEQGGVTNQAISQGGDNVHDTKSDVDIHEKVRETSELSDGVDDRKMAESANQEESKVGLVQNAGIGSSSQEESEGTPLGEEAERGTDGRGEESEPESKKGEGEREEDGGPSTEGEGEGEESTDDEMMTFEEFKQKKREEG